MWVFFFFEPFLERTAKIFAIVQEYGAIMTTIPIPTTRGICHPRCEIDGRNQIAIA